MAKSGIGTVLVSILAAVGLAWVYPPARLFAEKAVGCGTGCPMEKALKAAGNLREQIRNKDRILNASKLIGKDPAGYHLFETPHGRWWVPAGDDYVLPFNLAEEARDIYGTGEFAVKARRRGAGLRRQRGDLDARGAGPGSQAGGGL